MVPHFMVDAAALACYVLFDMTDKDTKYHNSDLALLGRMCACHIPGQVFEG
jgi:hypothetical protein